MKTGALVRPRAGLCMGFLPDAGGGFLRSEKLRAELEVAPCHYLRGFRAGV